LRSTAMEVSARAAALPRQLVGLLLFLGVEFVIAFM
jgi:hypothetical protein